MSKLPDIQILQIFVDAIDDRWKDPHQEKPKQLKLPYELAKTALIAQCGDDV